MVGEPAVWTGIGVLAGGTYYAIFRGVRASGLWKMFLKTYVPPERHGDVRLRVAFVCYNLALFLWLFRIWAWLAEAGFQAVPEKDLIELTNGVLGAVYATAILGAVIFIPYVRKRVDLLEREEGR
ncbi:MAG: hypothetical protein QXO51_03300 [Halobacteria archaeon]